MSDDLFKQLNSKDIDKPAEVIKFIKNLNGNKVEETIPLLKSAGIHVQILNKAGSAPLSHIPVVSSNGKGNSGQVISSGYSSNRRIDDRDYHVRFDDLKKGEKSPKTLIAYDGPTKDTSSVVNIPEPSEININQPVTFPPLNSSNNTQSVPNLPTVNNNSPNQESQDKEKLPSVLKSSQSVPVLGETEHKLLPKKEKNLSKRQDGNSSQSLNKKKKGQRKPALPKCNIIAPSLSMSRKQKNAKKERAKARKALAHPAHVPIDKRGPFFVRGKRTDHDQVNSKKNNSAK